MCTVFPTNKPNHPRAIHPNETVGANIRAQFSQAKCVGAVPACPPERPRSGVSIPKIHASRTGNERRMRPCRATRAGTQAPPLPNSIIFFHASHTNKITIYAQSTQTKPTVRAQSTQTKRVNNPTTHTLGGGNASRTPAPIL